MSFLKELFDGRLRRARAAEARGELRAAAGLYAEAGMPLEAGRALMHDAERASQHDERVQRYLDALRTLPADASDLRKEAEVKLGRTVLAHAKAHGAAGAVERTRLEEAASALERHGAYVDAADAWELLGRKNDLARCLELGGEIDRLEAVLAQSNASDAASAKIRRLVSEAELASALGDRESARVALAECVALAPGDPELLRSLRELEAKWPRDLRVKLAITVDGKTVRANVVGRLPITLGRSDADVVVRGGSVSRAHCEIARVGDAIVVRDLSSRNGTLVKGFPIAGELALDGPTEVGLGDEAAVNVVPRAGGVQLEVVRGLDRGERTWASSAGVPLPGVPAQITFDGARVLLVPADHEALELGARTVRGKVDLLVGDVIQIGGARIEVLP